MFAQPRLSLPTVPTKNEAQANQNDTGKSKLSVADSLVLLQSLKQSRSMWLTKAFLRFSTRSKDKADQVNPAPPPHSLSLAGSCDLEIGPHLFPQTKVFFVQYRYGQPSAPAATSTPAPPPTPAPAPATPQPPPITVSHELHARVVAAAAKDPDLHHVLQLASQGRASVTQLRTLGTAIKAIEAGTYSGPASAPPTSHTSPAPVATASRVGQAQSPSQTGQAQPTTVAQPQPVAATAIPVPSTPVQASTHRVAPIPNAPPPPKPINVPTSTPIPATAPVPVLSTHVPTPTPTPTRMMVPPAIPTTAVLLEFAERPIDRWLLPTEYVLIDRRSNGDIHLSTFYPFDAYVPAGSAMRSKPAHPITMRFVGASSEIWNALSKTCTTVTPGNVQAILAEVANPHAQSFLLPSKTPIPTATTARQRRTDSAAGGVPKKRKIDPGDSTTSKPKAKGKGKEKEPESVSSAAPTLVPTNQPAAGSTHQSQAIAPGSVPPAPASQSSAPVIPNVVESTSNAAAVTAPALMPNTPVPKPKPTTSTPLIDALSTTSHPSLGKGMAYSARVVRTSTPDGPSTPPTNPTGPLCPPQHPALTQTSPPSQPQTSPPFQSTGQLLNQNMTINPPDVEGKSQ